jgi:hypothetical protein
MEVLVMSKTKPRDGAERLVMATREVTLDELRQSSDWAEVFGEESSGNTTRAVEAAPPGSNVSTEWVGRGEVAEVIAAVNGENDCDSWLGVFRLKDGRYLVATGACDYTGWDCRASNSLTVLASMEDLMQFGLSEPERLRLGL